MSEKECGPNYTTHAIKYLTPEATRKYSICFGRFAVVSTVVAIVFELATVMNDMQSEMLNWYVFPIPNNLNKHEPEIVFGQFVHNVCAYHCSVCVYIAHSFYRLPKNSFDREREGESEQEGATRYLITMC